MENIRREAMQKTKTVVDNAMAQIRPLLTPEQQKKLDESQNDRRGGRGGRHGQRDQNDQSGQGDQ
jgi:Spy/CpxP family protein refolding chaperone